MLSALVILRYTLLSTLYPERQAALSSFKQSSDSGTSDSGTSDSGTSDSGTGQISEKISCFCPVPKHDAKKGRMTSLFAEAAVRRIFMLLRSHSARGVLLAPALVIGIFCNASNWCVCTPIKYRTCHQHAHHRRHHESAPMVARKKGG